MSPEVQVHNQIAELQAATAEFIAEQLAVAYANRGKAILALAGGNSPLGVYKLLAASPLRERVPWQGVWIILGDERLVPIDHEESNAGAAKRTLLDHVPIPPDQILFVPTDLPLEQAAATYDQRLRELFGNGPLDLALLGIGPDGHTASLFPGLASLDSPPDMLAIAVADSPKPPPERVSLSLEALNRSAQVCFLVAGADKAPAVTAILAGDRQLPAARVQPKNGQVWWFLDQEAASELD